MQTLTPSAHLCKMDRVISSLLLKYCSRGLWRSRSVGLIF